MLASLLVVALAPSVKVYTVDGVERKALVYAAAKANAPLVFVFHGHGGGMLQASRSFRAHELWPEATVVYPDGLPTASRFDPDGKAKGWQIRPGAFGDRDLKFFDAMLATFKDRDPARTFVMGHSNGGAMTYLLWATRRSSFAAFGPSGSPAFQVLGQIKPGPMFATIGEADPLISPEGQKRSVAAIAKLDGIDLSAGKKEGYVTLYSGRNGMTMGTYIHPGGHEYPAEAAKATIAFFKSRMPTVRSGQSGGSPR